MTPDEVRNELQAHELACERWRSDMRVEVTRLKWWLVSLSFLSGANLMAKGFFFL